MTRRSVSAPIRPVLDSAPLIGSGKINQTTPFKYSLSENQDIGRDTGTAVVEDYKVPFVFEGKIEQVVVELAK